MFFLKELPSRRILENYKSRFPEMNVASVEGALKLMHRASMLIRRIDTYFSAHDFSQLRFLICIVIHRDPEAKGLTPSGIRERIDVSKPVLTRTLLSMAKAGFVEFEKFENDKRAKLVILTDKALRKLQELLPGYYSLLDEHMATQEENDG